ncbi:replication factor A 51 kDa subunit-like [Galendromus occidentalis]|uniref:Replication factor A 51 kDa subunit-like n=1 Tax=Galendromus occidentalis TaxID=34638 RepID=A0AAJ7L6Q6_9ACAR|nr:replication factor A 51 kDa subunit-like [Galendromus occidentalis]
MIESYVVTEFFRQEALQDNELPTPKRQEPGPKSLKDVSMGTRGGYVHGRVLMKTPIRAWKKEANEGKIFSFIIADNTAEMNVVVAGDICESIFDKICVGECYEFSAFRQKVCNPQYKVSCLDIELVLTKISSIQKISGDHLPKQVTSKIKIGQIVEVNLNKLVNLTAIVFDVGDIQTFTCRDGQAHKLDETEGDCITITNASVREYRGIKSLTATTNTVFKFAREEPEDADMEELLKWWKTEGLRCEFGELRVLPTENPREEPLPKKDIK